MDRLLRYFSFQGRANRQRFWLTAIAIVVIYFVTVLVLAVLSRIPVIGILAAVLLIGVILGMLVAALANSARRLHDRAKSAWWLLLFQGVPAVLGVVGALASMGGAGAAGGAVSVLGFPITIWALVELGCLRGTDGPNRFGDDPLKPVQEVFA